MAVVMEAAGLVAVEVEWGPEDVPRVVGWWTAENPCLAMLVLRKVWGFSVRRVHRCPAALALLCIANNDGFPLSFHPSFPANNQQVNPKPYIYIYICIHMPLNSTFHFNFCLRVHLIIPLNCTFISEGDTPISLHQSVCLQLQARDDPS